MEQHITPSPTITINTQLLANNMPPDGCLDHAQHQRGKLALKVLLDILVFNYHYKISIRYFALHHL